MIIKHYDRHLSQFARGHCKDVDTILLPIQLLVLRGSSLGGCLLRLTLLHVLVLIVLVVSQLSVEALDVSEDTFPVRLLHPHHVLHVQQRCYVCLLPNVRTD